ncbi:MAG: hypothetical protein JRI75_11245 [Deltaproteobacteria bacterium]|nr:hypothetical protein [Deltaproteobacteria bacterium]
MKGILYAASSFERDITGFLSSFPPAVSSVRAAQWLRYRELLVDYLSCITTKKAVKAGLADPALDLL